MRQADKPDVRGGMQGLPLACLVRSSLRVFVCVRSSVGMMNANLLFDPELLHFAQVRNKLCTALRIRNLIATNSLANQYEAQPQTQTAAATFSLKCKHINNR